MSCRGEGSYGEPTIREDYHDTQLHVGAYCSIAAEVTVFLGGAHRTDWVTSSPLRVVNDLPGRDEDGHPKTKGDVVLQNDVWIARGATILSGVTLHNGSAVGACSVVTKDVPPYAIVAGNPARVVRYRFEPQIVESLQRIAWWDWSREKVLDNVNLLCSDDIWSFIRAHLT